MVPERMNPYSDVSLENAPEQSDKTPANAPAGNSPTNPYEDTAKQFEQKRDLLLNRAIKRSLGNPPDEIASILGISRNTGLSPEVVRNNREDVETRVKQREIGAQVASLSQTGQEWLTEKYNLDISQDDLANIKAMDDAITNKSWYEKDFLDKLMDSSVKTGTINVRQMASSIEATPGMNRIPEFDRIDELLAEGDREAALSYIRENDRALAGTALKADLLRYIGAEPEDRAELRAMSMEQISRSASQIAQQESERQAIPNDPGLTRAMEDGSASAVLGAIADDPGIIPRVTVESLITSAPSLAAGVFGTMSGALPAAAGSAMASYGTERGLGLISALRDAGVDTSDPDQLIAAMTDPSILEDAQRRAELKALPISMLDMLGAGLASRLLAPTSVAGKTLTTRQREAINLFTQMPVQGIQEGAGEASGQYLADGEVNTAEVALETIAGAFGSTSDVLAFSGNRVFESVVNNANSYRRAKKDRAYLTAVKDAANQTQLRKRDPQALKELLNRLSQTGPVDEIYISGKDFQELFQSKNLDPEEYAQKMESVGQQYHESLLTGGDIAVSVADFAAVIAPTEAAEDFILRARTKTDGMSPAEADQWMNEQARPTLEAIINYDGDQAGQSAQKVFDDVVGQLLATGMDQQTAERNASLYRAFFDVMGQTEDVDPFDLYQQYNLAITREMPEILKRRDNNVDALDPLLDRLRSGDVPSQQSIFGASLTDFLREQGGVQDYAGELSAMDADKTRQAFQRNLVSEQGLDLATAAERAAEAGYIESRDTNQLLAALDTELRGDPIYARGNEDAKLQETAADLMALQEELDRLGIDLAEVDNATAKEALNSVVYGDAQQGAEVELQQADPDISALADFNRQSDEYQFENGDVRAEAIERLVSKYLADDGFQGMQMPNGSGFVLVTPSAKEDGAWQVTQFAEDGTPNSDNGLQSKEDALRDFFSEARPELQGGTVDLNQSATQTEAFRNWFGDSKVVDEVGNPLVMYHASQEPITSFDRNRIGEKHGQAGDYGGGFYFSGDPAYTDRFGEVKTPVYLSIENPLVIYDGQNNNDGANGQVYRQFKRIMRAQDPESASEYLRGEGFDGVIVHGAGGSIGTGDFLEVVAFRPEQIKSATGNRGTFDPNDTSILNQSGRPASDIERQLKSDFPGLKLSLRESANTVIVDRVEVPEGQRESGTGTKVMQRITEWADANGKALALTPSSDFGGNKRRLKSFYKRFGFVENQGRNKDFAVSESMIRPIEMNQDIGGKRGVIRIDRTNRNFNIELLAKADLSTFLHESGHFFLEVLGDLSQREGASDRVKGQYQTILDWFEVESRDQIGVEQHEQFARGFEAYLMEGKAPTPELQSVFARFRAWLMAVYKRLSALNVDLTDEVRNVMDRILATDEEIERARGEAGMADSLSDVAAMGWTEQERADYRDLVEEAREAAKSDLIARQMKDLRKTEKDWYKQERAKVRDEVMAEMSQNRVYRALAHLQSGKLPDGSELPSGLQPVKLSKEMLVAQYGAEFLKRLPGPRNKIYSGPYIYSREGGVSPEILADLYGFSSGDEMIQAFANARAMKPLAEAEADARMRERYPDINLSGEAAEAAIAAVHNDKAADRMLMEMKKLHSKSRFAKTRMTPAHVLRQAAQRLIQGQRVKDIRPDLYRRAEARAANDAFTEATNNDFDSAFESKQRQLLNHYLYREAAAAREAAESTLEYVKRFSKKSTRQRIGKAGSDYLEQIDAIIDQYEFRRVSLKQISRRRSLQSWVDELKADGIEPEIPQSVLQQAQTVNYKEISVEELQGIRDALTSIEHLARTKNKLLSSQFKREFGETVDSIVSSIGAHHEIKQEALFTPKTNLKGLKNWGDQYVAAHAKPEFILEYLDGNQSMGPVWQALFKPLSDAENAENKMTGEAMERLTEIMGEFKEEQRAQWFVRKTYIPEIGTSMTKSNMIAMALNWGNEGNRRAVLEGYGWSQEQAQAVLNKLTESEWQMVQNIWDLVDSYWPEIAQLQKDLTGLAPEKVERTPVETPFGVLPGGYYPLKYDPETSFMQFKRDESVNTQDLFENNFLKPTTKKGHTIERVGSAGMQVRLDLAVLGEHIYQVIHDLSHRRAIIDVDRLIGNVRVRHAIEGTAGKEAYRQLRPWLQAIANDTRQPSLPWERVISHMRAGGTIVNMGWKFTTAIVQPLGYLQSVDQIGAKWAWKGLRDFYGSPDKMAKQVDFVFERSEAMKNRQRNFDRDVRDYARRLEREGKMDGVRESFFWMTGMLDMSVSVPTWLGAYRKAMEGHVPNAAKGDEAAAIDYADQAVRESQSSGAVKDLARIQRGNEAFRAFTMFYSYFSALFNLLRRRRQDLQLGNINLPQFAASMAVLWIAPAVLGELVAMRGPDDDEEWAKWAAQQSILYPFQTMIGVRDVANAALTPFGFGASPAYDGLEQTARALQVPYKALTGEEVKRSDVKSIVLATSYWGHLPGRQTWITGEYLFDLMDGKENPENPGELLDGLMFSRPANER